MLWVIPRELQRLGNLFRKYFAGCTSPWDIDEINGESALVAKQSDVTTDTLQSVSHLPEFLQLPLPPLQQREQLD